MRKVARRKPIHRARRISVPAERMETRVMLSFTPYVSDGWSATPGYEWLNAATGATGTAVPAGSTSPAGAPLTPATMRAAYGMNGISFNGVTGDGTGQTIAIVDAGSDPDMVADLETFDAYYGLANPPSFQQLSQTGSTTLPAVDTGWPGEISLDVEWSHVMAPNANIILIAASDLYAGDVYAASYKAQSAVDQITGNTVTVPAVSVISESFGISGSAPDGDFVTPSGHQGVTFLAATGDSGGEVGSPAQSPNVVAVGGTNLQVKNGGYGSESAWSAGGGGVSSGESQPAYQKGIVSNWSTTQRTIPDVSMDGDPGSGVAIVDSYDAGSAAPWELIIGGTSLATPLMAGVIAVADQGRVAEGLGTLDGATQTLPRLYDLSQANYSANFHDITTGNNTHPATTGYDLASGLGSTNGSGLIPDLAGGNTVSGRAFVDVNGNSTYDSGTDTPLAGKAIYLDLNNDGAQEPTDPTATTASDGTYTFTDVVGSITGTVRLVGTTGYLPSNTGTFTTAYGTTAVTYNLIFTSTTPVYAATATPATTTLSTTLAVTTTGGSAASGLTYTWSATTRPLNATVTYSANGTAAATTTTATFNTAGTYVMTVKITDASGHSTYADVTVVVTQLLTSIKVPQQGGLTGGHSEPLEVDGYDQFGGLIGPVPATWTVVSGGGSVTATGTYTAPQAGTLATVKASVVNVSGSTVTATGTVPAVASPWVSADVGNVVGTGVAYDSGGTTTLVDQSDDIYYTSDDFHFDYLQASGDVTITAELDSQTSASTYIKAGLMIRNTLAADDVMVMENDPSPGPLFEWRATTPNGSADQDATNTKAPLPEWLRVSRVGNVFTGYSSPDGNTWTQTGSITITMNTKVYIGLALTSHDSSNSATAVFSDVSVTYAQSLTSVGVVSSPVNLTAGNGPQQLTAIAYDQNGLPMTTQPTSFTWAQTGGGGTTTSAGVYAPPATAGTLATVTATTGSITGTGTVAVVQSPWTSVDVGKVTAAGLAYDSATTTTLTVTSDDIWNQSDDFHFDYQAMTGNGTITAELNSQTSGSSYIKAGLMMRNSLDPADAMVMVNDPGSPLFEWRPNIGGTAVQTALSVTGNAAPEWMRLVRAGNAFSAYYSKNGTSWTLIGSQAVVMGSTIYVGLALTSHDTSHSATAVFSNVTISNPNVSVVAAASPNPVTAITTSLSVLGASLAGESTLTYTWAAVTVPSGAMAPTYSVNGTNAAKSTIATFSRAGTYLLGVTVADTLGQSAVSLVTVTVNQTLATITLSPTSATVADSGTSQFTATAKDQFGAALTSQPTFTWNVDSGGAGTVSTAGLYTAPATGSGTATVRATSGSVSGTATVTVTATTVTTINGTSGNDVIRLVRSGADLLVYVDNAATPAYTLVYAQQPALTVLTGAGTDSVNVDFSGGATPVPAAGLTITGGGGADTLIVTGTTAADTMSVNANTATVNGSATNYGGITAIVVNGNGGADGLTQTAQPGNGATLEFNGGTSGGTSATDSLTVSAGTYAFAAPVAGSGIAAIPLASLSVGATGTVTVGSATARTDRWVVDLTNLSIATGGTLALGKNDMVVTAGVLSTITGYAKTGYANGYWTGTGLAATADSAYLDGLGVIQNVGVDGTSQLYYLFDGVSLTSAAPILVKYTYYGDANLSGLVDAGDYTRTDAGYLSGGKLTGWANGDYNYDGTIDGSDYTLMDNAFDQQGITVTPSLAVATPAVSATTITAKPAATVATKRQAIAPASFATPVVSTDDQRKARRITDEIDALR